MRRYLAAGAADKGQEGGMGTMVTMESEKGQEG